jgi:hypothetical protein
MERKTKLVRTKARELQKMLRYRKWQEFEKVISIGIDNLESVGQDVTRHLMSSHKLPTASDPVQLQDYKLSRLACYHIALVQLVKHNNA